MDRSSALRRHGIMVLVLTLLLSLFLIVLLASASVRYVAEASGQEPAMQCDTDDSYHYGDKCDDDHDDDHDGYMDHGDKCDDDRDGYMDHGDKCDDDRDGKDGKRICLPNIKFYKMWKSMHRGYGCMMVPAARFMALKRSHVWRMPWHNPS